MLNELINICKNEILVSLYTNQNDISKFIFGKILSVNDNEFAFYMISPDGKYDGVLVKEINSIVYFETDNQYIKEMCKLCDEHSLCSPFIDFNKNNIKTAVLLEAMKSKKIVSLELNYSGFDNVVGFVEDVSDNLCKIKQVDLQGLYDGVAFVVESNITQISYDSHEEQQILARAGQSGDGSMIDISTDNQSNN